MTTASNTIDYQAELASINSEIEGHRARLVEIDPAYRKAIHYGEKQTAIDLRHEFITTEDLIAALGVRFLEVQVAQVEYQEREARTRAEALKAPFEECDSAYRVAAQAQGEAHALLTNAVNEGERLTRQLDGMRASLGAMRAELNKTSVWR